MIRMPVVFSERHIGHAPGGGSWLGVWIPGDEEPERGAALLAGLGEVRCLGPTEHGLEPILAVHDRAMVDFLATAHQRWVEAGHPDDPGQPNVVPYLVPRGRIQRPPTTVRADVGRFAADTLTVVSAGTYDAARAAIDCCLTAADLVLAGEPAAYAAVRPPGHHAGRDYYGGSCYLNNAAVTAQYLRQRGVERVSIIDIDAHHGNGIQDLFYERGDVSYASVHVDPGAGWYPHFCGYADERGDGAGFGTNHNRPLLPGSDTETWVAALSELIERTRPFGADALVVALGVDAATGDPESPLEVDAAGFAAAGERLGGLGLPTVFVQEGGYDLAALGPLVSCVLEGFESSRPSPE